MGQFIEFNQCDELIWCASGAFSRSGSNWIGRSSQYLTARAAKPQISHWSVQNTRGCNRLQYWRCAFCKVWWTLCMMWQQRKTNTLFILDVERARTRTVAICASYMLGISPTSWFSLPRSTRPPCTSSVKQNPISKHKYTWNLHSRVCITVMVKLFNCICLLVSCFAFNTSVFCNPLWIMLQNCDAQNNFQINLIKPKTQKPNSV